MNPLTRIAAVALSVTFPSTLGHCQPVSQDVLISSYRDAVTKHFLKLKNSSLPLFASNYRIGDVWDSSMGRLLEPSEQCFRSVSLRAEPDTIPSLTLKHEASIGLALRLKRIFDATATGSDTAVINVAFDDVIGEAVAEGDLRRSYIAEACPIIRSIIDGGKADHAVDLPVIVGRLYRGKRRITISYGNAAEVRAKLESLVGPLSEAGLDATAKLGLERSLVIVDRERVPLAFAPAFVPIRAEGVKLGGDTISSVTYEWVAFQPSMYPSHIEALSELARVRHPSAVWDDASR